MAEDLTSNYILENSDEPVQDAETVRNTETRPVAIMFTDIEGSTAYYEEHGDVAGREMIETHNSILFPIITTHNGMIVRTMGDGLMACFERPESSVRAAIAMQMALLEHNEAHPETVDQIHVRIGLNCGDALVELSEEGTIRDVHGDVVNTASRVETGLDRQADEILVSKSVERAVSDAEKIATEYVSAVAVRNKRQPLSIYRVIWHPDEIRSRLDKGDGEGAPGEVRAAESGRRHAIVIGVDRYQDRSIPNLKYARLDAGAVAGAFLVSGDPDRDTVTLLVGRDANLKNIRTALSSLRETDPHDQVVVYFAGYGCPDIDLVEGGREFLTWRFLAVRDTEADNLFSTALSLDELRTLFQTCPSRRVVLLLDSCGSGSGPRAFSADSSEGNVSNSVLESLSGVGRVTLSAAGPNEKAFESGDLNHGLFTYYLLSGLASGSETGKVGILDLYDFVTKRVVDEAAAVGGTQHPALNGTPDPQFPIAFLKLKEGPERKSSTYAQAFKEGEVAVIAEDWDAAEAAFKRCLDIFPHAPDPLGKLDIVRIAREGAGPGLSPEPVDEPQSSALEYEPVVPRKSRGGRPVLYPGDERVSYETRLRRRREKEERRRQNEERSQQEKDERQRLEKEQRERREREEAARGEAETQKTWVLLRTTAVGAGVGWAFSVAFLNSVMSFGAASVVALLGAFIGATGGYVWGLFSDPGVNTRRQHR